MNDTPDETTGPAGATTEPEAIAPSETRAGFVALIGAPDTGVDVLGELAGVVRSAFRPRLVLAGGDAGATVPELLRDRPAVEGRPSAYVCERFACKAPVVEPGELASLLDAG